MLLLLKSDNDQFVDWLFENYGLGVYIEDCPRLQDLRDHESDVIWVDIKSAHHINWNDVIYQLRDKIMVFVDFTGRASPTAWKAMDCIIKLNDGYMSKLKGDMTSWEKVLRIETK